MQGLSSLVCFLFSAFLLFCLMQSISAILILLYIINTIIYANKLHDISASFTYILILSTPTSFSIVTIPSYNEFNALDQSTHHGKDKKDSSSVIHRLAATSYGLHWRYNYFYHHHHIFIHWLHRDLARALNCSSSLSRGTLASPEKGRPASLLVDYLYPWVFGAWVSIIVEQ